VNISLKLFLVFSVAFSLATLTGPTSNSFHLPTVPLTHANPQACPIKGATNVCSEYWIPGGPEMNTLTATIFTDATAEFSNIQSTSPSIDFTDSPLPPSLFSSFTTNPNFLISAPVGQAGYYEIQFLLANSFWACQFNFGNSQCGVQIRQGIAHMFDKRVFTNSDPNIAGISTPIDNPVPTTSDVNILPPNPCGYDASFPQTGTQCAVGALGGTAYHLLAATGADGIPMLYAPGSSDLNAAAQHFVNAGLASGFNTATSVLTGISPSAATNVPSFFIRSDDPARLDLGNGIAAQICYLFTGSYTLPCAYLAVVRGPLTAFPGIVTSTTTVNLNWWMYTASYSYVPFFDDSLYLYYNSLFVSGIPSIQPPNGTCSAQAVPTSSAEDYMYLCSANYDNLSKQMETTPCLTAPGDPVSGATSNLPTPPGNGLCPSGQPSADTAGIQAEAYFGANAFTLPVFERTVSFGYLNNGWIRAVNNVDVGIPNYFTWLNAYNPTATVPWTIRLGLSHPARSLSPFAATSDQELTILGNVYDPLYRPNPLDSTQLINWMTPLTQQLSNSSLTYTAPPHTLSTFRFILRSDMFFQDGRPVTSYDVAFSYLSMVGAGAFIASGAASMTGITILGPHQFDIGVNSLGVFTLPNLASIPILSGRYWTGAGSSAWDNAIFGCTSSTTSCPKAQYALSGATVICPATSGQPGCGSPSPSANIMQVDPTKVSATYDPIANHIFVGSGPFECGIVTSSGSGSCTPSGTQSPGVGQSFTLPRFGNGLPPASSVSGIYFRSSGNTALWIWARNKGDVTMDFLNFAQVASCYGQPVNLTGPCGRWQHGMGNPGTGTVVGVSQVAIVNRFFGVNWVAPFDWQTNPPTGIVPFPPVLYEGSVTLNPSSVVGCPSGYDC
jgi:ABC-type transport system substrate-binding protein